MSVRSLVKIFQTKRPKQPLNLKRGLPLISYALKCLVLVGQTQKLIGNNLFMSSKCSLHEKSRMAKTGDD